MLSWNDEYNLRRAIRNGDEEKIEEILRREHWAEFDEIKEIFEDERKGHICPLGDIEYGNLNIHDHFGRPKVRKYD